MAPKAHILVVEDDADVREALVDVLEAEGFSVATAEDGRQALDYLRGAPSVPALILLDLMMPNMNGLQFRDAQLREPAWSGIPVVMLTASMAENVSRLGTMNIVRKPFLIEGLLAAVKAALDGVPSEDVGHPRDGQEGTPASNGNAQDVGCSGPHASNRQLRT